MQNKGVDSQFHYRVRGLVYKGGAILVAKFGGHTFLPGGHIEDGESAPIALAREFMEELGVESTPGLFLGAIENSWTEDGVLQHEINLIFEVDVPDLDPGKPIVPREAHLNFLWLKPDEFEGKNFLPIPARDLILRWVAGDKVAWWGSTM